MRPVCAACGSTPTGGMPIEIAEIPDLAARIGPFGWHLEFLFPGKDIVELMPVFSALAVPMSIE